MDLIDVELAGEIEQGRPLLVSGSLVRIPAETIEEHEIVYRVRRAPEVEQGDLLIIEPRNTAFTGELVVAFRGVNVYLGRWWAKHGLQELRETPEIGLPGEFQVVGAVTVIVRTR
ncbi:MAG TPA: hypothetical protein VHT23_04565 [Gemmatimonadaceae bacterium]|jgi:hypothetical protein|nr:hypothetical protein [Gemmatimonadaceae bacterium]